jgi:predicted dehydrogenase
VRAFLDQAASFDAYGGRGTFLAAGLLAGPFRTPWRLAAGPLLDLGPHVVDLMDAALGPVVGVRANGRLDRWVVLELEHEGGAVSESALCSHTALPRARCGAALYGESGVLEVDTSTAVGPAAFATLQAELAAMVRSGAAHALDVGRGLHLQRVIEQATAALAPR